jgi:hypothetical protein
LAPAVAMRVAVGDVPGLDSGFEAEWPCFKVVVKPAATFDIDGGVEARAFVGVNGGRTDGAEAAVFLSRKVQVSGTTMKTWSRLSSGGRTIKA